MKASNGIVATVAAVFVASTLLAESFSTDCVSLYGLRNNSDLTIKTDITYSRTMSQIYIGKINSFHGGTFLAARLPSGAITNATVYMAIDFGGTITDANVDIWSMGFYNTLPASTLSRDISKAWLTYDNSSPVYANSDGSYTYLNGHAPVKISDDAVPMGTQVSKGTLKLPVSELLTEMGLAFNRGATTNGYIFLRFNTDAAPLTSGFRPAGYSTEVADSDESKSASRIFYSALDGVAAPAPRLSAEERASDWYVRSTVEWVQYRDSDGAAGFSYPAYCGVKDGKTRDLIFTFDAPEYTVTNAWLTLNALPPFVGTIPGGARVKLSLLGFVDAPAVNTDLVVTDAMLEGQEEVVLQENVLLYGIASGTSLLSEALGQRNLIRALNARAKAAALANSGISGKKAVLRLSVTSRGGEGDWGFSIGSVATPGVEAFFECVEYRKWIDIFTNTGFEDGMTGWTITTATYTENQMSVIEDPTDSSNHCLRFWNTDTPTATLEVMQAAPFSAAFLKSVSGRPCKVSYRVYLPSTNPLTKKTSTLTEYGWYILGGFPSGSYSQMITGRACDNGTTKDKWLWTNRNPSILPDNLTSEFRMYLQFRFSTAVDTDDDAMYYVDDITVKVQDFYDYPDEPKGMMLIFR